MGLRDVSRPEAAIRLALFVVLSLSLSSSSFSSSSSSSLFYILAILADDTLCISEIRGRCWHGQECLGCHCNFLPQTVQPARPPITAPDVVCSPPPPRLLLLRMSCLDLAMIPSLKTMKHEQVVLIIAGDVSWAVELPALPPFFFFFFRSRDSAGFLEVLWKDLCICAVFFSCSLIRHMNRQPRKNRE